MSAAAAEDVDYTALDDLWRRELRRIPTADLEDEREHVDRERAELRDGLDDPSFCSNLVAIGPLQERYRQRAAWIEEELERRARIDATGITFAPRRIPAEWLDELKSRVGLGAFIITEWPETKLRKSGDHLVGHCPLHDDHTPSFHVWQDQARWHCFGCNADGDVFDLLLSTGRAREFRHAVELVAVWSGVAMPATVPYRGVA